MRLVIKDLSEMTDSREMLESNPVPVITIFINVLIALITAALLWAYFSEIDIYVKAQGIVRPSAKISTIKNKVPGRVKQLFFDEGKMVKKGDILYAIEVDSLDIEKKALISELDNARLLTSQKIIEVKINDNEEKLNNLKTLKQSLDVNKNLFSVKNEYYFKFADYIFNKQKLERDLLQKEEKYKIHKTLYESMAVSEVEFKDIKVLYDGSKNELERYKNEFLHNVLTEIKQCQILINDLTTQLNDTISKNSVNIAKLQKDLQTIDINIKDTIVAAPIDGIVNVITEINRGDLLQGGVDVLTIIPESEYQYKVQLLMPNEDIANIEKGQDVKFNFLALPYREYGELTGVISNIGTDARIDQRSGKNHYTVDAVIHNKPLYSYKGKMSEIKVGMACEARVIVKTKKILYYLLEKINLRD